MRPVIWSAEASEDYLNILRFISEDAPAAAEAVVDAIETAGNKLGQHPSGRPGRVAGTYEKSVARLPYILSYMIDFHAGRETIVILRVIHTSRDWQPERWPD